MALTEFLSEYSGGVKLVVAALAVIAIILALCTTDAGGVVLTAFNNLITSFYTKAAALGGIS